MDSASHVPPLAAVFLEQFQSDLMFGNAEHLVMLAVAGNLLVGSCQRV